MEIWDHKTTGDISLDQTHLPLDLQTHLYYLGAWKHYGLAYRFIHSFQRRFDFVSDQRVGPLNWERTDGTRALPAHEERQDRHAIRRSQ